MTAQHGSTRLVRGERQLDESLRRVDDDALGTLHVALPLRPPVAGQVEGAPADGRQRGGERVGGDAGTRGDGGVECCLEAGEVGADGRRELADVAPEAAEVRLAALVDAEQLSGDRDAVSTMSRPSGPGQATVRRGSGGRAPRSGWHAR